MLSFKKKMSKQFQEIFIPGNDYPGTRTIWVLEIITI